MDKSCQGRDPWGLFQNISSARDIDRTAWFALSPRENKTSLAQDDNSLVGNMLFLPEISYPSVTLSYLRRG